jgi:hypothetical protein
MAAVRGGSRVRGPRAAADVVDPYQDEDEPPPGLSLPAPPPLLPLPPVLPPLLELSLELGMTAWTAPTTVPAVVATTCVAVSSAPPTFSPTRFTTLRARAGAFFTARFMRPIAPRPRRPPPPPRFAVFFFAPVARRIDARPRAEDFFIVFFADFFVDFFFERRAALRVAFFLAIACLLVDVRESKPV